jgi:hypothetical protein
MASSTSKSASGRKPATDWNGHGSEAGGSNGPPFRKPPGSKAYSFALVTGALFLFSWLGQFIFQMITERNEAEQHGQSSPGATSFHSSSSPRSRIGSRSSCSWSGRPPDWRCSTTGAPRSLGNQTSASRPRSMRCCGTATSTPTTPDRRPGADQLVSGRGTIKVCGRRPVDVGEPAS